MSRIRVLSGLSAALALSLAGCGGDTTGTGDPLSEAEAAELAAALAEGGFGAGFFGAQQAPMGAPGAEAANITVTLDETYPCNEAGGSGTVDFEGSISLDFNEADSTGSFDFDYTMTPHGCTIPTASDLIFTITGDPDFNVNGDFDWSDTGAHGTLHYEGDFAWEASDSRAGTCGVDLTSNYEFSFSGTDVGSASATVSGSICGFSVNRSVTYTA